MEKKIYKNWAYSGDEAQKAAINKEIYDSIKDKATVQCVGRGYGHNKYVVVENPEDLSLDELALICDEGNLCFGYRTSCGEIIIHTD